MDGVNPRREFGVLHVARYTPRVLGPPHFQRLPAIFPLSTFIPRQPPPDSEILSSPCTTKLCAAFWILLTVVARLVLSGASSY